ncbi:MAG: hypothetical protein AABX16_03365 [Nanoarchaeota archaeon]
MNLQKLLDEGKIEKVEQKEFSSDSIEKSLDFAKKGLEMERYDEVMPIAYNSIFRISNKLMNHLWYRAIGKEHHKNVFEFLVQAGFDKELAGYFDTVRKKRNDFIYRDIEKTSREEAQEILSKAKLFVHKIRTFVQKKRTGEKVK